jgi:hypothetical protein
VSFRSHQSLAYSTTISSYVERPALFLEGEGADTKSLQAQALLLCLRYLGDVLGLVLIGIAFQLVLKHNLLLT